MNILSAMKSRRLLADGGTGSVLFERGLKPGELPELWNLTHPEKIVGLHEGYLNAGANIITTNTFGANALKFDDDTLDRVVTAAIHNAKTARMNTGTVDSAYIALDLGPTGKLLKPLGDLDFERAVELYAQVVRIGVREGVDLILIETIGDTYELKAAVLAAKENASVPVFATVTFDSRGKMLTGGDCKSVVALLEGLRVDVLGVNCSLGPVQLKPIILEMLSLTSLPMLVSPNAGLPRNENGVTTYDVDADTFAQIMFELCEAGVSIAGGCCGTTPEHIRKTHALCSTLPPAKVARRSNTYVSSYTHAVEIGPSPVIVGERINPTGKKKLKLALINGDFDYLLREGIAQQDNGAHVLDVNVGLPEIDEPSIMAEAITQIQGVIDLPLQIDTSNVEAMARGLRLYNGKALVNSVSGKMQIMEAVFPLIQKYGGVVVGLLLDEEGIPATVEGRLRIARKIYDTASRYGIDKKDIILDGLCMTVSAEPEGALTTLETLRQVHAQLGGKTILGVSNVSFGLPQREIINSTFFTMALTAGLDVAIINPNSEALMRAYYAYRAIAMLDPQCSDFIRIYSGATASLGKTLGVQAATAAMSVGSLSQSIERGLKEQSAELARQSLKSKEALVLIDEEMIPALTRVGEGFERGTLYLPQLLMSAEAASAAFDVIRAHMQQSGTVAQSKGTIVLATVEGDIHDIGKNIVKVLLENYAFDVIDLGKDVPPQKIVDTAIEHHVPLVGLSALMTTTVPTMEATITLLREQAPWVKVVVGGAVLTADYAKAIGADAYGADAMATVRFAQQVIG